MSKPGKVFFNYFIASVNSTRNGKIELTRFLVTYLTFASCVFFVSPYRLVEDIVIKDGNQRSRFVLKSFWLQRILCLIYDVPCLFWLLREIRLSFPTNGRDPSMHFRLILSILSSIVKCSVMLKMWRHAERFLEIVNFLADGNSKDQFKAERSHVENPVLMKKYRNLNIVKSKMATISVCLLYTTMTIFNIHVGRGLQGLHGQDQSYSFYNWDNWVEAARHTFFLGNGTSKGIEIPLSIIAITGFGQRHVLSTFGELLLLVLVLTLWSAVKSFSLKLENDIMCQKSSVSSTGKSQKLDIISIKESRHTGHNYWSHATSWRSVQHELLFLEKLAKLVNNAIGSHMTWFLMESVIHYATNFDSIFVEAGGNKDLGKLINLFFFLWSTCTILIFAADVCYQVTFANSESCFQIQFHKKKFLNDGYKHCCSCGHLRIR